MVQDFTHTHRMNDHPGGLAWYCVRTVFRFGREQKSTYEERLTLWFTAGFSAAISAAEAEANEYARSFEDCAFAGLTQVYELSEPPGHGAEVFSLMRDSSLTTDAYVTAFFDTGNERQDQPPER